MGATRRLASAMRAKERGWDWQVVITGSGPAIAEVEISIDEATSESRRILLDIMDIRASTKRTQQPLERNMMQSFSALAMAAGTQGKFSLPNVTWTVPPALQSFCQTLAFVLIVAWIGYIIAQYAMPSKRGAKIKWGRVAVMGFGSILLLDLNSIPLFVNAFFKVVWAAGSLFFPTYFASV